jgi:hypothetical protein
MPAIASRRTLMILAGHALALAGWTWFASTVAPSWIAAAYVGQGPPSFEAVARWFGGDRPASDVLKQWEVRASAIGGALAIHAALVLAILRWGRGGGRGTVVASAVLIVVSLAFLVVSAVIGDVQDYHLYLDIWREILAGRDPWYLVVGGPTGSFSLHAYGPLYNLLALPTLWNPLGPKLIFAGAYWTFAASLSLTAPRLGMPPWSPLAFAAWFAGPFAWVEIAGFGHFDVLVAFLCVAAIQARANGRWGASAGWTASGVLLKYFPGVLAPFLALDRGKVRWRWLATTAGLSVAGLGVAWSIWGPSVFRPLALAAGRESAGLSIFRVLRGSHSPIGRDTLVFSTDEYAGPILLGGLFLSWRWTRRTELLPTTAGVLAVATTLTLYKVGFPQYFMVLYLLTPYWFAREFARLSNRVWIAAAYLAVFAWVTWYDVLLARGLQTAADDWAGLVTFPLMAALTAGIALSGRKETAPGVSPPTSNAGPRRA